MGKFVFLSLLLATQMLFASDGPEYTVAEVDGDRIALTTGASFVVCADDILDIANWRSDDKVIFSLDVSKRLDSRPIVLNGSLVMSDLLYIRNTTRRSAARVALTIPPTSQDIGTRAVLIIDLEERIIVLNDSTQWLFSNRDLDKVRAWEQGELVMVGGDHSMFPAHPSILFHGSRNHVIHVDQDG